LEHTRLTNRLHQAFKLCVFVRVNGEPQES
jgi:hypothetical protein